jgi:GT2 family glycosyltransferase
MEVILVEDKGGSEEGRKLGDCFPGLNISYYAPVDGWGHMGYMRNVGLSKAMGEYVLFLDDDTVILDQGFVGKLIDIFSKKPDLQAVIPHGFASYALIDGRYDYHDPFFFTNRCMAYRRSCLIRLNGFDAQFIGQEDVEFAIRFIANGLKSYKSNELTYYHPPMVYIDTSKGKAVGASFARSSYPWYIKTLLFINGSRWLPLALFQGGQRRHKAMFAKGFVQGFLSILFRKNKSVSYR